MANPQLEDGRTEIANELVDALARAYFNPGDSRVLWAILRKTYGWHKKTDRISYTQFEKLTGMNRRHIADALNRLVSRQIITRSGNNYKLEYGLNKNYDEWNLLPIVATNKLKNFKSLPIVATKKIVTHSGNTPLPIVATKSLPIVANTKATKALIQKQDNVNNDNGAKAIAFDTVRLYFQEYKKKTKKEHPKLKKTQMVRVVQKITDTCDEMGVGVEEMQTIVRAHFRRHFDTDWNLNHFTTGRVIELLLYDHCLYEDVKDAEKATASKR